MVSTLRRHVAKVGKEGIVWQQVVDGLRAETPLLWSLLNARERSRFLRHVRPFWEIHRHRTAPEVADAIERLRSERKLDFAAGSLTSAEADAEGVDVTFCGRGHSTARTVRVSWVVNCTGPGVHNRHTTHAFLRPLLEDGTLCNDELSLGLLTDSSGRAIGANGEPLHNLLVAGTLRKATLWESTAVPELREQAQVAALTALDALLSNQRAL
jgi:uncharacterized NAD(P)/FAD-binding protein YdhS